MRTYQGFTFDYVLYDLSYANLLMLSSVIPSYDGKEDKKTGKSVMKKGNAGGLKGLFSKLKGL